MQFVFECILKIFTCMCKLKKKYVRKTNSSSTGALSCSLDSFTLQSDFSSRWLVWDYTYILKRHLCAYICACTSSVYLCASAPVVMQAPVSQRERKDRAEPPRRRLQTSLNLPISLQSTGPDWNFLRSLPGWERTSLEDTSLFYASCRGPIDARLRYFSPDGKRRRQPSTAGTLWIRFRF